VNRVDTPDRPAERNGLQWLWLSAAVIILDQATKLAVSSLMSLHEAIPITDFFTLVYWDNTGAAFSLFATQTGWQRVFFIALALVATGAILWLLARRRGNIVFFAALSLILGGAVGNVIDRMAYGHVLDFLLFHYRDWYWPAFNVADSAITVGAGLLVWDSMQRRPVQPRFRP
jgi:signal peptidase II